VLIAVFGEGQQIRAATGIPFNLAPIIGLSTTGGFEYELEGLESVRPFGPTTTASPSSVKLLALSRLAPSAIAGSRAVQSIALRLKSRTPSPSRWTMIRYPSCLISCIRPAQ
jgi:hypothetical protein